MPTYSYRCEKNKCKLVLQRAVDDRDNEVICPNCDVPMTRYYEPPAIKFNGSGFYSTGG